MQLKFDRYHPMFIAPTLQFDQVKPLTSLDQTSNFIRLPLLKFINIYLIFELKILEVTLLLLSSIFYLNFYNLYKFFLNGLNAKNYYFDP